ncbi:MAG: Uma2 family endonuclease [Microcoleus sp. PH2017_39_LGB_O_B]|uniref:Uma2 family endonuclease n=1 Tax=unclassified Microcoleus TaxID=2642155 RepID=UPI001E017C8F|nr:MULTISPECIES: Uma2 family endonuclease [unclassified Microcoleus]MCC3449765.1 Uma2 family endonuclease [Microcoleus sp. PH2017_09_SFU_O_A]MCC3630704.1 Uma2 family endonuclease [Microcoleus sp. PH2017_39_LGB_O_B]MCC3642920.1 Uma2 family endonuclease [Microcoleus sp. PH2017_33_LGB_O_A]TAF88639.1 MAG: Uma2 family endonuclease [Oscillatoriales cyanobacterium]
MVVAAKSTISLAEFLQLPETKPASEYTDGQIYQKPMPQGKHSKLQSELLLTISEVGEPQKLVCALPELCCTFADWSIVPDIAVFEWSRIPLDEDGEIANRFEIPPDWIIEILSPDQSPNQVIKKIIFSINHGTKLGWFADPSDKSVIVFQPNQLPEVKSDTDILPVLSVLGDWQLSAAELFNWLKIN